MSSASSYTYNRDYLIKEQSLYDELQRWLPEQPKLTKNEAKSVSSLLVELFCSRQLSAVERRPLFHQARKILSKQFGHHEVGDFGSRVMKWYDDMLAADEFDTMQVMCQRFLRSLENHVHAPVDEEVEVCHDSDEDHDKEEDYEGWYDSADEDDEDEKKVEDEV
jgi:hypothetical protein